MFGHWLDKDTPRILSTANQYLLAGTCTERLRFRLLEPADFERWLQFFQYPPSTQYWDTEGKDPLILCTEWFEKQKWRYDSGMGGAMVLTGKSDSVMLGWVGLLVQEVDGIQELEVGYSMLPEYWGRGFATEAARACKEAAFAKKLAPSLISIIQIRNTPSCKVAEKNGMTIDRQTIYKGHEVWIYRVKAPSVPGDVESNDRKTGGIDHV